MNVALDILVAANGFDGIEFCYNPRNLNAVAYQLAR